MHEGRHRRSGLHRTQCRAGERHALARHIRFARDEVGAGDRGHRAGHAPVREAFRRRRMIAILHVDVVRPVVAIPARAAASAPPGLVRLAPAERDPAVGGTTAADRDRQSAARPRHERRRPHRPRDVRARHPSPAAADVGPAAIVEWCVAPWRAIDPRQPESGNGGPVAVAVRCPAERDAARKPDVAIVGVRLPCAVVREIGITHHLLRDIALVGGLAEIALAIGAPCVERVEWNRRGELRRGVVGVDDRRRHAGQHLLQPRRHLRRHFTFAHGHRSLLLVRRHGDAVQARTPQHHLRRRRIDHHAVACLEHVEAQNDIALRDEEVEVVIVERPDVDVGGRGHPHLRAAEVHLGVRAFRRPQVVAVGHRIVEIDGRPVLRLVRRREIDLTGEARQAADARRHVAPGVLRPRGREHRKRQREHAQCSHSGLRFAASTTWSWHSSLFAP